MENVTTLRRVAIKFAKLPPITVIKNYNLIMDNMKCNKILSHKM